MNQQHKDAFLLGWIAAIIRWVENLVNLISGPLLTVGLGIALVALLTDGKVLTRIPLLLYIWAISQAVGVDAQLVSTWDRAHFALRERRYWSLVGLILLGGVLAYIAWVAAQVFALQESAGITTAQALAQMGMNSSDWLVQRTALSVFLVCLAGYTRYHPPAKNVAADSAAEKAKLEAEMELEPLRNQLRAQQARGWRGAWDTLRGKEMPSPIAAMLVPSADAPATSGTPEEPPQKPPTGPGAPVRRRGVRTPALADVPNLVHMSPVSPAPSRSRRRRKAARARGRTNVSVEDKARAVWRLGMSANALEEAAGISRGSAQKYHAKFTAEDAALTPEQRSRPHDGEGVAL